MNRKLIGGAAAVAALIGLTGCDKSLAVRNVTSPGEQQVLGSPADAENLLGTYYKRWSLGVYRGNGGAGTSLEGMANVMSLMNYSGLANNCQNSRTPFSGAVNNNSPGNTCKDDQYAMYQLMGEVNRVAALILGKMKNEGLTMGNAAQDARDKSFAEFLRGMSIGYTALMYDSAAVVTEDMDAQDVGTLYGYQEMGDSAYAAFQRAIDYANVAGTAVGGFPISNDWIPSPTSWTAANFIKLIRSYRARIRANMARNPAERAAVDWPAVIADAQNGITEDHKITTSTTAGPYNSWRQVYETFTTWHQMPPFVIGMADVSGAYAEWTAKPLGQRGANNSSFTMVTPDTRFPSGDSRPAQQADFAINSCGGAATTCTHKVGADTKPIYFVNRPTGSDVFSGVPFGTSNYDFIRFHSWATSGDAGSARNGATIFMTLAEMDMLQAEGLYRTGNYAAAGALVNKTRVAAGLPAITTFDATTPVPGGATNCIPKVPAAPNFATVTCGNLWEALKYEKRIETAYTHYAAWFLDMRGWGDLPEKTPLYWAIPFQEMQTRQMTNYYGTGDGPGNALNSFAAKGTYGW